MVIRDKQELKRCVKQAVRRAQVTETDFSFDVVSGSMGVSELLQTWAAPAGAPNDALRRASEQGTPFCEGAAAMFAALSALELPTHNLNNAQTIQESYDRPAYLREVLDAMRVRRVLVSVPADRAAETVFDDDRLASKLVLSAPSFFAPGRYGVDYQERAGEIARLFAALGARDLEVKDAGINHLRYCLIPVSEDTGCVLHLYVQHQEALESMTALLAAHPQAKAIVSCCKDLERALIDTAVQLPSVLVQLDGFEQMRYALSRLNTRFIPFASHASLPEQMLGRWEMAREPLWQTLLDAYLPLARAGYELTSEAIAQDVHQLLGGNIDTLYGDTF